MRSWNYSLSIFLVGEYFSMIHYTYRDHADIYCFKARFSEETRVSILTTTLNNNHVEQHGNYYGNTIFVFAVNRGCVVLFRRNLVICDI